MKPLVTIITPCYNSAGFIVPTINSVIAQTYQNWELIVIDDQSTDETCAIVETFTAKHSNIKLIKLTKNAGVANARNIGIAEATGKYIAFLDSDDIWLKEKLSVQVAYMEKDNLPISFCAYNKINEAGDIISKKIGVPFKIGYDKLLWHNLIIFSTSMVLKSELGTIKFKKVGHEDWLFWLELLKKCQFACGIDEQLVLYRIRKNSISANKLRSAGYTWKLMRQSEKLGLFKSIYLFSKYAVVTSLKFLK